MKMEEKDIQKNLDTLGNRVSQLSEENRLCKLKNNAGKELMVQLQTIINSKDWIDIYESCENAFVKIGIDLVRYFEMLTKFPVWSLFYLFVSVN